jgi:large subunit ribosomal protein L23
MIQDKLFKILMSPHVSDKAYMVADKHSQIVFKVVKSANKFQIKKAVESLFDVEVACVRTLNVPGKKRRSGKIEGKTKEWKKAYVKLKEGHDINFVGSE